MGQRTRNALEVDPSRGGFQRPLGVRRGACVPLLRSPREHVMTQALNRIRVALDIGGMTDADLLKLVLSIAMLALTSSLITVASIQACVAAIAAKGAAFKTA